MLPTLIRGGAVAALLASPPVFAAPVATACRPTIQAPWVRVAPPGTSMLAGYAIVRNDCAVAVTVVGAESLDFASASLHTTVVEGGVSRMRAAGAVRIEPHARLVLAPGGQHLMLMGPARALPEGARARIRFVLADGARVFAEFPVQREPPR
jgi:copper(I)-binding protein